MCSEFAEQFVARHAAAPDVNSMHVDLFVFVAALANGVCATLTELDRQDAYDALIDIVLRAPVLKIVEQAYREQHRAADDAWQLKLLELQRCEPAMLGVPPSQCRPYFVVVVSYIFRFFF